MNYKLKARVTAFESHSKQSLRQALEYAAPNSKQNSEEA